MIPEDEVIEVDKEYLNYKGGSYIVTGFAQSNFDQGYTDGTVLVLYVPKNAKKGVMFPWSKPIQEFREKFSDPQEPRVKLKKILKQTMKKDYYVDQALEVIERNASLVAQVCTVER